MHNRCTKLFNVKFEKLRHVKLTDHLHSAFLILFLSYLYCSVISNNRVKKVTLLHVLDKEIHNSALGNTINLNN